LHVGNRYSVLLILWLTLFGPSPVLSANMTIVGIGPPAETQSYMSVQGVIEVGDWGRFVRLLAKQPSVVGVLLDSEGGSLDDGLAMAKHIYEHQLLTMVTRTCHSVCAVMFLAGREKYLTVDARITVHSAYKAIGDWVVQDSVADGTVAWFLGHMGYPLSVARLWVTTRSDTAAPITLEMNDKLGLGFTLIE
jgi:hypothetical protein